MQCDMKEESFSAMVQLFQAIKSVKTYSCKEFMVELRNTGLKLSWSIESIMFIA